MTLKHCHKCDYNRPEAEVVVGVCLQCRSEVTTDERPVTAIVAGLLFRRPKPQPRKVLAIQSESGVR